jgi:Ca2+-binding EF-hand superfamily protein
LAETFSILPRLENQAGNNALRNSNPPKKKNTMKIKTLLIALSAAILIPAFAQAKPEGERPEGKGDRPNPGQLMKKLDTDENGSISKEEAKGPLAKNFDKIDANSDGEITKEEFAKASQKMRERRKEGGEPGEMFAKMDANESGSISKDEAGERLLEHFDEIDSNSDGELTKEELRAAAEARHAERGGKKKGPEGRDAN